MEFKKDYAVLFKKEVANGTYGVLLFNPCYVIDGIYDKENQVFLDEMNIERPLFNDGEIMDSEIEYCVGFVCTEDALMARYPNALNVEEAKIYFNDEAMGKLFIGICNYENNAINILNIDLDSLCENFKGHNFDLNKDFFVKNSAIEITTDNDIPMAREFYKKLKESYGGYDFTIILKNEFIKLINIDNIDKLKEELKKLKENKDQYYSIIKSQSNSDRVLVLFDSFVDELLNMNSIDDIQEQFAVYYSNTLLISSEALINDYESKNDAIQKCANLEDAKGLLSEMHNAYSTSFKEIDEIYDEEQIKKYRSFLLTQIKALKILLTMDNLTEIKKKHQDLHDQSASILDEACEEIIEILGNTEQKTSDEEQETKDEQQLQYDQIFKQKTDDDIKKSIKTQIDKLNMLVGLDNVKEMIERITARMLFANKTETLLNIDKPSMNMVFTGNPGTGKTTVASIIAPIFHELGYLTSNKICVAAAEDLVAGYVGQTAIKTKKLIDNNRGGLIVIDEAYVLASNAQQFGMEALTVILKEMETNRTAFVFAGYEKEMTEFINMNSGLKSRIKPRNFVKFKDYSTEELVEIFRRLVENASISKDENKKLRLGEGVLEKIKCMINEAKRGKNFGNARYVNSLFQEVMDEHSMNVKDATSVDELLTICLKDLPLVEKPKEKTIGFNN